MSAKVRFDLNLMDLLQQNAESAVMFTRLDSERNAKIMKKAVVDEKLDPSSYKVSI